MYLNSQQTVGSSYLTKVSAFLGISWNISACWQCGHEQICAQVSSQRFVQISRVNTRKYNFAYEPFDDAAKGILVKFYQVTRTMCEICSAGLNCAGFQNHTGGTWKKLPKLLDRTDKKTPMEAREIPRTVLGHFLVDAMLTGQGFSFNTSRNIELEVLCFFVAYVLPMTPVLSQGNSSLLDLLPLLSACPLPSLKVMTKP